MRNIKFRIFDKCQGEGVMQSDEGHFYITSNGSVWDGNENTDITDRVILMQYTGLKDENGRDIYEGDVVEMSVLSPFPGRLDFCGEVKMSEGSFYLVDEKRESSTLLFNELAALEVIGNIHEHPYLLKGE